MVVLFSVVSSIIRLDDNPQDRHRTVSDDLSLLASLNSAYETNAHLNH